MFDKEGIIIRYTPPQDEPDEKKEGPVFFFHSSNHFSQKGQHDANTKKHIQIP